MLHLHAKISLFEHTHTQIRQPLKQLFVFFYDTDKKQNSQHGNTGQKSIQVPRIRDVMQAVLHQLGDKFS